MARLPTNINENVYQVFIYERQLNRDEIVIYAAHKYFIDDWDEDNYYKVITIDSTGNVKVYVRSVKSGADGWFSRYLN